MCGPYVDQRRTSLPRAFVPRALFSALPSALPSSNVIPSALASALLRALFGAVLSRSAISCAPNFLQAQYHHGRFDGQFSGLGWEDKELRDPHPTGSRWGWVRCLTRRRWSL
jgi:hypothetical protein